MTRILGHRASILAIIGLSVAILTGVVAPLNGGVDRPAAALGALAPLSETEAVVVGEALVAFDDLGLTFAQAPVISFHEDKMDCADNLGYWTDENGTDRVRVCWTDENPAVQAKLQTQALVHELAHAWVYRNSNDAGRATFSELVGAERWEGQGVEWADRGTEVAAELVTWAVLDPAVSFIDFHNGECRDWGGAFTALTGRAAPTHVVSSCG